MSVHKGITCEEGANVTSIRIGNKTVPFNIFLDARKQTDVKFVFLRDSIFFVK